MEKMSPIKKMPDSDQKSHPLPVNDTETLADE